MRCDCPLLMTGSQSPQILEAVPASESEKDAKDAGCQPGRETENALASDKENKAEAKGPSRNKRVIRGMMIW